MLAPWRVQPYKMVKDPTASTGDVLSDQHKWFGERKSNFQINNDKNGVE